MVHDCAPFGNEINECKGRANRVNDKSTCGRNVRSNEGNRCSLCWAIMPVAASGESCLDFKYIS